MTFEVCKRCSPRQRGNVLGCSWRKSELADDLLFLVLANLDLDLR